MRACRGIPRNELTAHPNPDFRIRVIDEPTEFYRAFADDIVSRIRAARDEGRQFVAIMPVGPMPQYALAAQMINEERLSLAHVHTFNMDEYASQDGEHRPRVVAGLLPAGDARTFFGLVDPELRPPESQIHFPTKDALAGYSSRIDDLGGADVCYGGIGWCGHIAFWESHLGEEFGGDLRRTSRRAPGSSSCTR